MKRLQNQNRISMPVRYAINAVLILALLFGGTYLVKAGVITNYFSSIILLVGINIILAVSLNVATGYLGQLPLGHAGFMAVGAYAGGIFLRSLEVGKATGIKYVILVAVALLLAGVVAAIFGIIIGIPALRLKGDYLAIITLGFGEIIRVILTNIDNVLGFKFTYGAAGLTRIPKIAGVDPKTTYQSVFLVLLCIIITCLVVHTTMKSRHGRAILSIRENEIAAESCGIKTTYYKVMAFTMSAFFAGVAGCLYAGYVGSLYPSTFGFMKSIEILVMVVLGGMGSMIGSVLSATALTVLPEVLRQFADYRMVVYSLVLVIVMIFKPTGLMGMYDFSLSRILEKIFFRKAKKSPAKKGGGAQ